MKLLLLSNILDSNLLSYSELNSQTLPIFTRIQNHYCNFQKNTVKDNFLLMFETVKKENFLKQDIHHNINKKLFCLILIFPIQKNKNQIIVLIIPLCFWYLLTCQYNKTPVTAIFIKSIFWTDSHLVSSSSQAIRMPFPPPPAEALIMTGQPNSREE